MRPSRHIVGLTIGLTAALALGGCAAAPADRSIVDSDVTELISGTRFATSERDCPRGMVQFAEYSVGNPRLSRPTRFSCVPESAVQSVGHIMSLHGRMGYR